MTLLVLDIGGSAVKYGLWEKMTLIETNQFPTPLTRTTFYEEILHLLNDFKKHYDIQGIGVSCPGEVNEATGMINGFSYVPFLHLGEFQHEFSEFVHLPITLMNDANAAALAEMTLGIGQNHRHAIFLIIGSGLGFSIVENGEIQQDTSQKMNEIEKNVATGIKDFNNSKVSPVRIGRRVSLKKLTFPDAIEGKEVLQLADEGDEIAGKEVDRMYRSLAEVVLCLNMAFQPEFIGIGGGISNYPPLLPTLENYVHDILKEDFGMASVLHKVFHPVAAKKDEPILKLCAFKNNANLIGAALHFQEMYRNQ